MIYNGIMSGAAVTPKIANAAMIRPIIMYLPSLPLNLRFDTFSESKGILVTISSDNITVKIINNTGEPENEITDADAE